MLVRKRILSHERGILYVKGEYDRILAPGIYHFNPFRDLKMDIVSVKSPWLTHDDLETIVKSGRYDKNELEVIDLMDNQKAIVWVDGRLNRILGSGLHAIWKVWYTVSVEIVDVKNPRLVHDKLGVILDSPASCNVLDEVLVEDGSVLLSYDNGQLIEELGPGRYAYWKGVSKVKVIVSKMKIQSTEISGQEILSADKVSLRLNTIVNYRINDAYKSVSLTEDPSMNLYREAQLALREVIGRRTLEEILADKISAARELEDKLKAAVEDYGITVISCGIKDIIIPGDMREILNKVVLASKEAEANLILRREETAAIRNQVNTARMLENNPVLMKMRELELLEKLSTKINLTVLLGEKGLADKITNLL